MSKAEVDYLWDKVKKLEERVKKLEDEKDV